MGFFDIFRGGDRSADEIAHDELSTAVAEKACVLIDVREPHEFSRGHVPGSHNMPLSRFDPARLPHGKQIVLICHSGVRSASALARARAAGHANARHYRGGLIAWHHSGGKLA